MQYLLFEDGTVFNIRSSEGYVVRISEKKSQKFLLAFIFSYLVVSVVFFFVKQPFSKSFASFSLFDSLFDFFFCYWNGHFDVSAGFGFVM
jgi:hypothetical protein